MDRHCDLAGDHVLHEVAQLISAELRPFDLVGRYGGEEFLLVINAALEDAHHLFERIRIRIKNANFNYAQDTLKVTISCGATIFVPPVDKRNNLSLIAAADHALYLAKESGRNTVVFAETPAKT